MKYLFLIHAAESRYATMSKAEIEAESQEYGSYTRDLFATGKAGDGAALESIRTATTVQLREGKRIVKDGPFAETREQLGGYYTFEGTEEEALAWASKIPGAKAGTIEVRPVPEMARPASAVEAAPMRDAKTHKEYLLLIYENETAWAALSEDERKSVLGRYWQLRESLVAQGAFVAGAPLASVKTAKSVHVEGDRRVVRDGPFAETREQLGGYYRVRARDLDEAIAFATKIPAVEQGTIEVRPVRDTSAYM